MSTQVTCLGRSTKGQCRRLEEVRKKVVKIGATTVAKLLTKLSPPSQVGHKEKLIFIVSKTYLALLTLNLAGQLVPLKTHVFKSSDRLDRHLPDFQWIGVQNGGLDVPTVGVQSTMRLACVQLNHLVHLHVGDENWRVHVKHQQRHAGNDTIRFRRRHLRKRCERRRSSEKKSCEQWRRRRIKLERICLQIAERRLQKFYWNHFVISSKFCLPLLRS